MILFKLHVLSLHTCQVPIREKPLPSFVHFSCLPLQGVLRIHLQEAQNLIAKDNLMGGMVKGKSDPYVKITIGNNTFKSHVVKENLNPTWNEMYEVSSILDRVMLANKSGAIRSSLRFVFPNVLAAGFGL